MTSFEGRVIAITGAASGIALATARLLASRGASISVADVRQEPLDAAVADIKKAYPNVKIHAKAVNVKIAQEVADWLDETIKYLGPLTGAVNLAGVFPGIKHIVDTEDADWDFVMDVNLRGVFNCIRAELQRMDKDASIVSTSSVVGLQGKAVLPSCFRSRPTCCSSCLPIQSSTCSVSKQTLCTQMALLTRRFQGYKGGAGYSTSKVNQ